MMMRFSRDSFCYLQDRELLAERLKSQTQYGEDLVINSTLINQRQT